MSASMHPQRASHAAQPFETSEILADVLHGLGGTRKTLPPKLFYDDVGARLFERICTLDEYYLTRSELSILRERAGEISDFVGARVALVEYGSGAATKVRFLLDALRDPAAYVPIDISREQLARVAADLEADYPSLAVRPICGDYTRLLPLPNLPPHARRVAFFPGSTIGNFHPAEAAAFLTRIRRTVGTGGALVIGVDRRKDAAVLHAAYDDPHGVTAAFNRNVLRRINRELGADFDLASFRHVAFFNDDASRIEMHLESTCDQTVHVAGSAFDFARGETIWTESSYKYDEEQLATVASAAGFRVDRLWTDANELFWVGAMTAAS
jgi:dimethylhistidine N-methyltransferase